MKRRIVILGVAIAAMVALLVSCAKEKLARVAAQTPEEAVEIFINGLLADDTDAMLSVTGHLDGSAIDDATYRQVRDEMNSAKESGQQELRIRSYRITGAEIDGDVAQCAVEVTYSNDSVRIEENTLVRGADGGWRLPFFE